MVALLTVAVAFVVGMKYNYFVLHNLLLHIHYIEVAGNVVVAMLDYYLVQQSFLAQ